MAELRNLNGRPAIFAGGQACPPYMATIRTNDRDHMVIDAEYYRELGRAGIRIFFLICDTVWLKPQAMEQFREEAEILLREVPGALIIPRIGLHPTNAWIEAHPEECVTYSDGSRPPVHLWTESYEADLPAHYCLCSAKWREDAGRALTDTWEKLMALPYADHIIGCFFAAGGTSEWYYMLPPVRDGKSAGYSRAFRQHFSRYLTERYGTDEALQKAWGRTDVTLDDPAIPEAEAHYFAETADFEAWNPRFRMLSNAPVPPPYGNGSNIGSFVNFNARRDVFDFYRARHDGTAESILHFARLIKRATPDRLVGAFYGSLGCTHFLNGGTCGGTMKLLCSPDVDFLAAPGVYENRQAGGFVGQREIQDSFALHNKIYIVEDDTRTHLENRWFADQYGVYDLTDSVNIMKREFGRTLCEDVQAWWFDQLLGGRRYKHPELYRLIARQQEIAREAYTLPRDKGCEIAFIYDEESLQAVSQDTSKELIEMTRNYEMARIGAPVDQYYHNDMALEGMPAHKLYLFFNTFILTDEERAVIRGRLAREGAVAVFMYGSGVINPDRDVPFDAAHMKDLTGMDMAMLEDRFDAKFRYDGEKDPIFADFDRRTVYGCSGFRLKKVVVGDKRMPASYLYPLFYPRDEETRAAAHFLTSRVPAVSVKTVHTEDGSYTAVYWGGKTITAPEIRAVAKWAGCHIFTDSGDVLYANRNYVTLHASSPGLKTVRFPRPCAPVEVYDGRTFGEGVTQAQVEMETGETIMLRYLFTA